ncbi:hypothetical protein DFP93_10728 [Aneurinibacillus soli]|uniref:Uncharacterized protein n=1 Tax=Aneurinibacillus soli TaxID=1500254 RepID=A0A0U5BE20_9BACL|nr:hypothetical protein [Aneurinibacillus soli]PYE61639.1 hypothetical protein DFP93_10728 [Aneurinibacillus soli]BAU28503.1 hypothetical protein CB4_02677 [Aneurinibacillus soli]
MSILYILGIVAFVWLVIIFFRKLRQDQSKSVHQVTNDRKRKSSDSSDSMNYGWFGLGSDDDHHKNHHHHGDHHNHHHNHHHNNDSYDCSGGGDSGGDSGGGD